MKCTLFSSLWDTFFPTTYFPHWNGVHATTPNIFEPYSSLVKPWVLIPVCCVEMTFYTLSSPAKATWIYGLPGWVDLASLVVNGRVFLVITFLNLCFQANTSCHLMQDYFQKEQSFLIIFNLKKCLFNSIWLKHREMNSKITWPWTSRDTTSTQLTKTESWVVSAGMPKLPNSWFYVLHQKYGPEMRALGYRDLWWGSLRHEDHKQGPMRHGTIIGEVQCDWLSPVYVMTWPVVYCLCLIKLKGDRARMLKVSEDHLMVIVGI